MNIDLHSHYIPIPELESADGPIRVSPSNGGTSLYLRDEPIAPASRDVFDFDALIRDMERAGLDKRAISVPPFCFQYELSKADGVRWSSTLNDALARAISRAPEQTIGFATVPMQDPASAVRELERCQNEHAFLGVEIASNINGVDLDESELDPFWDAAESLRMPVLIHPHYVAGIERMGDFYLRNLIGNPLETSLAGARLIFGGVLDRHPNLKVILSHGGGTLPYVIGRLQHGFSVRDECRFSSQSSPADQFQRLYYDTIVFDHAALRFLVDQVGASQVVIGTDYPFDMSDSDPIGSLENAGLTETERAEISRSAAALLPL